MRISGLDNRADPIYDDWVFRVVGQPGAWIRVSLHRVGVVLYSWAHINGATTRTTVVVIVDEVVGACLKWRVYCVGGDGNNDSDSNGQNGDENGCGGGSVGGVCDSGGNGM
ncbi:hypothetical protein U1Q18_039126 [Sarracenia purpurea var. burkii]